MSSQSRLFIGANTMRYPVQNERSRAESMQVVARVQKTTRKEEMERSSLLDRILPETITMKSA